MDNRLIEAFFTAYPLTSISLYLIMIIGTVCFFRLSKDERKNIHYWLPFLILSFTFCYENLGNYTNYNYEFKKSVNEYLGNFKYPKFNLWLYNVATRQIGTVLYLLLIKSWTKASKKKYINWMIIVFIVTVCLLQFSGVEPIYLSQPIIFALGANMILVAVAFYFIDLITDPFYLAKKPLKLVSFWLMTSILFSITLSYISSVTLMYLYEVNPILGQGLQQIQIVMKIISLGVLTLVIASPFLPRLFDKELSYESY
ncbi:histidine kinase [Algoriphagus chordae]|uniref:Uncharacterized protein n=1 Tax=Algoriphagus chordae TaxID=237019 RepID=A0A2W7RDG3_9BACT|nr:histidine kinase [Algoriphagus chordae]PZX58161.1 hypothetical protein LV85_00347 [Algoriphagus chordae]